MSTVNFYLDKPNRKNQKPIILTYLLNGSKFRYSTKLKTDDNNWNPKKQVIKRNGENEGTINFKLNEFVRVIEKAELEAEHNNRALTLDYIREKLDEYQGKVKGKSNFSDFFNEYIEVSKGVKTESTIKTYKSTLIRLQDFEKEKKYPLTFDNINLEFYEKYVDYLMNDKGFVNNTIGDRIKILKAFMTYATEKGYNKNFDFKKFKVFKEDGDSIYLTEAELFRMYNLKTLTPKMEAVKDVFCFGCFTGLRFSDLIQIKPDHIKGNYIELKSQKTRDSLRVPLNVYAKAILKKYEGELPRVITNQKMNEYLKDIGKLADINESIVLTKYKGAMKIEKREEKYKFISTHTARRTFVTLLLEKGMRAETVMSITGHKDYSSFKKYIKLTENIKLAEMNNIWN